MTSHRVSLDLPYKPEELFELASDIGRYPDFVRWIQSLRIMDQRDEGGVQHARAEARVGFKGFTETFVTDIVADRPKLAIDVTLVRGPFRKLRNAWRFAEAGKGTKVDFSIDFEFRNILLQALAEANKAYAIQKIIEAFTAEAARRYRKVEG